MANREAPSSDSEGPQNLLGATINGRYKILSLIARGGMGKVYRAEQSALGRVCALKVLAPHYEGNKDPEFHKRFSLEASTAAKLQHPNTVTIFDYGRCEEHDVYYIAMEFLDGRTLHRVLHDERTLPEVRASHIAQQVCRSVHEAHRLGVVHRDLKPSNILLVERGDEHDFVKVLDFGLVKDVSGRGEDLTQTGLFMGSPKYMAPEQVLGTEISARTDVYALGVILYEMIAGKVPFDRKAGMSTLVAHVNEAPPPLSVRNPDALVSPEMEAIVMRCLEKEPDKRFASMKDLLTHLKRAGGDLTDTHESLPRARIDYEAAMKQGKKSEPQPNRASAPPPSISGTLRSALPGASIVAPQTGSGPLSDSGPLGGRAERPSVPEPSGSGSVSAPNAMKSDSLSPPQASRTFTGAMPRPAPAWRPYAVAVLASIIGGGTAAVVLSRRPEAPQPGTTSSAAAVPTAVAIAVSPTSEAPRGPDVRILRIDSEPPGAIVSDQGVQVCMHTPCDVYWQGKSAKLEHKLSLEKKGWKPTTVVVAPADEKVVAKLEAWGLDQIAAAAGGPRPEPAAPAASVSARPDATASATPAAPPPTTVVAVATPVPAPTPEPAPAPTPPPAVTQVAAAPTAGPMHVEDVDTRPKRVSCAAPTWPREALEAKVSGTVVAKCVVTEAGSLSGCRIVKGVPFMDGPVLASLATCKYTPAMAQGKPVPIDIPITMKLTPP